MKPKQSQNEQHPQDIQPERGSALFTRQEETVEERFTSQKFLQQIIGNRTEKKIAIIGEPGAGKTTLLQKLAFWLLQKTDDLVIWVDLAELGGQSVGEYLQEKWLKAALVGQSREEITADWEQKFKGGAVWLLLDGLDEMSQSDQQALKFRGWVTDAQMIVTCRLNLWQANPSQLQGFQTYLTQPFQNEQMQKFIHRWFPGLVEAGEAALLAESLWSELQAAEKERIKDLCRNPLRLTLLCATWKVDNALPETMAELYEGFVESIYAWKEKKFEVTEEEKEQLNEGLGALAKASLEAETSRFRLTHESVCDYLGKPKAKGSLCFLALKLGWLNEVGVAQENRREKVYAFYHATFQEYFAALAVEDWDYFLDHVPHKPSSGTYRIFEPQWKQVILLWLGRKKKKDEEKEAFDEEKEAFIEKLINFEDGVGNFYGYQAYFLAAAGINEFKDYSWAMEIVQQVVKLGFGDFNPETQKWLNPLGLIIEEIGEGARKAIEETIRPLAISALIDFLDRCPYRSTRMQAAERLKKIDPGSPEAILLKVCVPCPDSYPWIQAAKSLGKIDLCNQKARSILVEILCTTKNENTERLALETLAEIDPGNQTAIQWLVSLIESNDAFTPRSAAESLREIGRGNPEAIEALVNLIATTNNERTRWWAVWTLGEIGRGNPEEIEALVNLITTENEDIRQQAAESLGKIGQGNEEVTRTLVNLIENSKDEDIRRVAAESLGKIDPGNQEAIKALVNLITNTENEDTRRVAAESLGKIGQDNQDATTALVNLITTENEDTRRVAAESLGKIDPGNQEAIKALVNLIENTENKDTRQQAAESLGKIGQGNQEAILALVNLIATTKDQFSRVAAARSLGKIGQGNQEAILALVNLIATTKDQFTWGWPVWSLGNILTTGPQYLKVVSALKHNLSDAVDENDFDRFKASYKVIWNCAENLPYPEFHEAWHKPLTTPHPKVTEQTQGGHNSTVDSLETKPIDICLQLQNLPIFCLNATILTDETDPSEIAQTLCQLIWETAFPDKDYPKEVTTASKLREQLKTLTLRHNLPKLPILITHCHPSSELIVFCRKLTNIVAIAWLTDEPLKAPLKGFPPNQPHLISGIQTWLKEI
ncbi:HEAT repeat domain-containing protein [Oscillatoria acuminata]|uniref:Putative NTPase (NACHT family) n=1 Tax=Oscillatoria acuminata PCC 6304 TaxID=56110 RepID=K9TSC8_9CYAN|nr:HEAT repeat domain-containing protein [Oscillatoria acuminata]AFY85283.1 putative NTPase (NACHT family) [Oscillatoria acuminata PCC 6304]